MSNTPNPWQPVQPDEPSGGATAWQPPQANPYATSPQPAAQPFTPQYPGQQPYGQQPYGQPYGEPNTHQPPAAQPHPYAGWPPGPPPAPAPTPAPAPARDANPLAALFDFSFSTFATPGLVKIVYILAVVVFGGGWLLSVFGALGADAMFGGGLSGLMALLVGWVPALLGIALTRFILEGVVALIRTHDRTAEIAERLDRGSDEV